MFHPAPVELIGELINDGRNSHPSAQMPVNCQQSVWNDEYLNFDQTFDPKSKLLDYAL